MLESAKIQRRQSEIRSELSALAGKSEPTEDELRHMGQLDGEYRRNETRYRAALIAEDEERREAGAELETRDGREWADLCGRFELRQAALALDEGRPLDGATAEIVGELRQAGGYRGVPIPWEALEQRAGETVASGTPDPIRTAPTIDRIFAQSVASRMGVRFVSVASGEVEYPIVTSSVAAGWADGETAAVAGPTAFATTDKSVAPNQTLGVTMRLTRRALKQSGAGLEDAVRRDMSEAIRVKWDEAIFRGSGTSGEPTGIITGASGAGATVTAVDAAATWDVFRSAITRFLTASAASAPSQVRVLHRPEVWDAMDAAVFDSGSGVTEYQRLAGYVGAGNLVMSPNALAAPSGSPAASTALLMTNTGGVAPAIAATWGAIDLIRDPYSDATSGGLRLTALVTADVEILRPAQIEVLTGLE